MITKRLRYLFSISLDRYDMPAEWLSTYRIGFALYGLMIFGIQNYSWIDMVPDFLFSPPQSFAVLFEEFPSYWFLVLLSLSIVVCFVLLLFGFCTIQVSLAITILLLIGNTFRYSIGKIDHDILYVIFPAVMAFSGWGNRYSWDQAKGRTITGSFPSVFILAVLLSFVMMTSAVTKVWTGWLDTDIWAIKGHLIRSVSILEREGLFASQLLTYDSWLLWKSADYLILFVEGLLAVTIVFPRLFRLNIIGLVFFHLVVTLTLGIPFLAFFPIYVLYFDWKLIKENYFPQMVIRWFRKLPLTWLPWVMIFCLGQWVAGEFWLGQPDITRPTFLRLLMNKISNNSEIALAILLYGATLIGLLSMYFSHMLKNKPKLEDHSSNVH